MKPATLDLPPEIGRAFVRDMRRYFAERNGHKRDEIAARQLYVLGAYLPQHTKFRLDDVKALFEQMRDHLDEVKP